MHANRYAIKAKICMNIVNNEVYEKLIEVQYCS